MRIVRVRAISGEQLAPRQLIEHARPERFRRFRRPVVSEVLPEQPGQGPAEVMDRGGLDDLEARPAHELGEPGLGEAREVGRVRMLWLEKGDADHTMPARSQHAVELPGHHPGVAHVLEHLDAHDRVDTGVAQRDGVEVGEQMRLVGRDEVEVQVALAQPDLALARAGVQDDARAVLEERGQLLRQRRRHDGIGADAAGLRPIRSFRVRTTGSRQFAAPGPGARQGKAISWRRLSRGEPENRRGVRAPERRRESVGPPPAGDDHVDMEQLEEMPDRGQSARPLVAR